MAAVRGFSLAKISKIRVTFNTFDSRVASAREFLRRAAASKLHETNPKCQIMTDISGRRVEPTVDIEFNDGSKLHFDASEHKALDMIIQVNQKSKSIS